MTTTNPSPATAPARPAMLEQIDTKLLTESPTNPRKTFGDLTEFTANVKRHGVLEPIIVRPHPGKTGSAGAVSYEIVCGHRRVRAAKAAGLPAVPSLIRQLTDVEVIELQLVENCQRADIHPMEEAEAYEVMHLKHKISVPDLAAKVGKSVAYIYGRLKLCALVPAARKAFLDGKLSAATALFVARIPNAKLQEQALKDVAVEDHYSGEPMSSREAAEHIQRHFMLRLADAPFKTDDAKLLPEAGACTTCPKRTGNQKELFSDVKSPDTCTDPTCFDKKKAVHTKQVLAEAEKEGQAIAETDKVFSNHGQVKTGWIDLKSANYKDPKYRTWKASLGKHCPRPTIAVDPEGEVHEIIRESDGLKAMKAAGIKASSSRPRARRGESG